MSRRSWLNFASTEYSIESRVSRLKLPVAAMSNGNCVQRLTTFANRGGAFISAKALCQGGKRDLVSKPLCDKLVETLFNVSGQGNSLRAATIATAARESR